MNLETFQRAALLVSQIDNLKTLLADLRAVAGTDLEKYPEETGIDFWGWSHTRQNRCRASIYDQNPIRNELLKVAIGLVEGKIASLENQLADI